MKERGKMNLYVVSSPFLPNIPRLLEFDPHDGNECVCISMDDTTPRIWFILQSVGQSSGIGKAIFLRGKNHGFEIFGEGN